MSDSTTAQGFMDAHGSVVAMTSTWTSESPGTTDLAVMVKEANGATLADLAGTWEMHILASGLGAPWWERAHAVVEADGTFSAATTYSEVVTLGRTGLKVGRLGVASGYWMPAEAIELAFEHGCNYFTWGTFIKGRSPHMAQAIRSIVAKGQRDKLVLAMFSYAHEPFITEKLFARGLRKIGLDHADALVLGFFSRRPSQRVIDGALRMKEKGLIRFIGLSGHKRTLFPALRDDAAFDLFHIRYNAVNRGPLDDAEMARIRRIGDHIYGRPRAV